MLLFGTSGIKHVSGLESKRSDPSFNIIVRFKLYDPDKVGLHWLNASHCLTQDSKQSPLECNIIK